MGTAYIFGTYTVSLVNTSNQTATFGGNSGFQKNFQGGLDTNGFFSLSLPSVTVMFPSTGLQWSFLVCANPQAIAYQFPKPLLPCFTYTTTGTQVSGASVDLSASMTSAAAVIPKSPSTTQSNTWTTTQTFTGGPPAISVTNAGNFTDAVMDEYLKVNINNCNSAVQWVDFITGFNTSGLTATMCVPSSGTKQQGTAVQGYVDVASGASGTPGVAGAFYARATAQDSHTFGLNTITQDTPGNSSINIFGYENDINIRNAASNAVAHLVAGVWNAQCGSCSGFVLNQPGAVVGGPYTWKYGALFQNAATAAPSANNAAIFFNPVATGATQVSQGVTFQSTFSDSTPNTATLNNSAAGNLTVATSRANTGFLAPMLTAGNALCTGSVTGDGCFNRSTTTGAVYLGSDGNVILFRNAAATTQLIGSSFGSNTTGFDSGYAAAPWQNLWLGTAATNNFKFQPAATAAARVVSILDPGAASNLALLGGTLALGNTPAIWNWAQTTNAQSALTLGETSAATAGVLTSGLDAQAELTVSTASNSTATPLSVSQGSITNTVATPLAQFQGTWNNASLVGQGIIENITNTASGASSLLENLQVGNATKWSVDKNGLATAANIIQSSVGTQTISGADYTNSTTTPSTVFSWTLPATAAAKNYRYTCDIMWESTNTTLVGPVFGVNISAAPTQLTAAAAVQNTLAGADINGYLSNATTGSQTLVTSAAAGVTSTNYWAKIWGTIEGAPAAGSTFIINAASTSGTTATLNIRRGSGCTLN